MKDSLSCRFVTENLSSLFMSNFNNALVTKTGFARTWKANHMKSGAGNLIEDGELERFQTDFQKI